MKMPYRPPAFYKYRQYCRKQVMMYRYGCEAAPQTIKAMSDARRGWKKVAKPKFQRKEIAPCYAGVAE